MVLTNPPFGKKSSITYVNEVCADIVNASALRSPRPIASWS
jgi:hypothetical protein